MFYYIMYFLERVVKVFVIWWLSKVWVCIWWGWEWWWNIVDSWSFVVLFVLSRARLSVNDCVYFWCCFLNCLKVWCGDWVCYLLWVRCFLFVLLLWISCLTFRFVRRVFFVEVVKFFAVNVLCVFCCNLMKMCDCDV